MINKQFEAYKIEREIKRNGNKYKFERCKTNEFGEPIENESQLICEIDGLYHEENSTIQITTGDTTQYRNKKIPMILSLFENTTSLMVGDYIIINNNKAKVTGVVNIQEWNIISDISLEYVDVGG